MRLIITICLSICIQLAAYPAIASYDNYSASSGKKTLNKRTPSPVVSKNSQRTVQKRDVTTRKLVKKRPSKQTALPSTRRASTKTTQRVKSTLPSKQIKKRDIVHAAVAKKNRSRRANPPINVDANTHTRLKKIREAAVDKLLRQIGKPYLNGGTSPETGFDCSGLIWFAYKDILKFSIPRTTQEMYHLRDAAPIKQSLLERGDLVFFRINRGRIVDHVGVYLGNGKFIQSPRSGKKIQISKLSETYWKKHYIGARRVMMASTLR